MLLGALGDGKPTDVYVGKAVKLKERLATHRTKPKIAWWRAVAAARDTTAGFNSAEIGYLEGRIASDMKALPSINLVADRYDLDTTLPPHMLIQLDAFVPTILAALRLAGLDLRSAPEPGEPEDRPMRGSSSSRARSPTFCRRACKGGRHSRLHAQGALGRGQRTAEGQILVDGKAYTSPSAAAGAAMPHLKAVNGWASWRTADGTPSRLSEPNCLQALRARPAFSGRPACRQVGGSRTSVPSKHVERRHRRVAYGVGSTTGRPDICGRRRDA